MHGQTQIKFTKSTVNRRCRKNSSGKHRQQSDTGQIAEQKQTLHTNRDYKETNKEA